MTYSGGRNAERSSGDARTSLSFLKKVWKIEEPSEHREQPSGPINTDIYAVPKNGGKIPRRSRNR